jgi:hypothetical protein
MPQCCNQTAHLASISDAVENERFRNITGFFSVGMIGLSNVDNPPTYAWAGTTEAVNYTNWCDISSCGVVHPRHANSSCAGMQPDNGRWFELFCTTPFPKLLVEYDCVPSPPTNAPTKAPTISPTNAPTKAPTKQPTMAPTISKSPTKAPTPSAPVVAPFACSSLSTDPDTGHLYGLVDLTALGVPVQVMTFLEARTFLGSSPLMPQCCNKTAHLASISDATENERFRVANPNFLTAWIGVNNYDNPPNYAWDGITEAVNYTNWCGCGGGQEPTLTSDSCAQMRPTDGKWNEFHCDFAQSPYLLVEYDCEPPPTKAPTKAPTKPPTKNPTGAPTSPPTRQPTRQPTSAPATDCPAVFFGSNPLASTGKGGCPSTGTCSLCAVGVSAGAVGCVSDFDCIPCTSDAECDSRFPGDGAVCTQASNTCGPFQTATCAYCAPPTSPPTTPPTSAPATIAPTSAPTPCPAIFDFGTNDNLAGCPSTEPQCTFCAVGSSGVGCVNSVSCTGGPCTVDSECAAIYPGGGFCVTTTFCGLGRVQRVCAGCDPV